jgi:methylase of polypeptide subunit release factors
MSTVPQPFVPETRLPEIAAALREAGVPGVLLRAPGSIDRPDRCLPSVTRLQIDILVPRKQAHAARDALRALDWRFELGRHGMWRAIPKVSYLWDDLVGVDLLWAIQGAPFAMTSVGRLEERIWATAEGEPLRLASAEDLMIVGAIQASRPGRPQKYDAEDLAAFAAGRSLDGVLEAAAELGVEAAVVRGLRRAGISTTAPRRSASWTVADLAWRGLHPRRLRGLVLTGTPRLGRAITRSRFAGTELLSGYGVFIPRSMSEGLVAGVLDAVGDRRRPVVVDVGTGCGAVALAIAARHRGARVHAIDTSMRALWWARINRPLSQVGRVRFRRGSLLDPVPDRLRGRVSAISANMPYVPPALWGGGWTSRRGTVVGEGDDGLGLYRRVVRQAQAFLEPGGRLTLQIGREQWEETFRRELEALGFRAGPVLGGTAGDLIAALTWDGVPMDSPT